MDRFKKCFYLYRPVVFYIPMSKGANFYKKPITFTASNVQKNTYFWPIFRETFIFSDFDPFKTQSNLLQAQNAQSRLSSQGPLLQINVNLKLRGFVYGSFSVARGNFQVQAELLWNTLIWNLFFGLGGGCLKSFVSFVIPAQIERFSRVRVSAPTKQNHVHFITD